MSTDSRLYQPSCTKSIYYLEFIQEKIHLIRDIYDTDRWPDNFYTQNKNPFDIKKISPIKTTIELNL